MDMKFFKKINTAILIFCLLYFVQYFTIGQIEVIKTLKFNNTLLAKEILFSFTSLIILLAIIKRPIA